MKHKYLTLLLTMLMSMAETNLFAYDAYKDGIFYNIVSGYDGNAVKVTYNDGYSSLTHIDIPQTVTFDNDPYTTYTVVGIGSEAFQECTKLTSLTIPNTVTTIGDDAFRDCSGLTSLTIPNSVTIIGEDAFSCCYRLTSLTIPNSVTTIGSGAFSYCSGLTSLTIPNSVTTIGEYAFWGCWGLTSLTIPNSVTTIGSEAFSGCNSLESITIEPGNPKYDSRDNCNAIIETSSNTLISGSKNTIIPNSVTTIGEDAFFSCIGLTSLTIPNSVTTIGEYAFWGCSGLTSLTIPNSVTTIGSEAFSGCNSLESITIEPGNPKYDSRDNCNAIIETSSNTLISGCKNTIIPNSVTTIESRAFYGCSGLTSLTIPNSVTTIGSEAFRDCSGLTSLTIPNSVTTIGSRAFHGTPLYEDQPNGVVYIGNIAYNYKGTMPSNTSIVLREGTVGVTDYAFSGCTGLSSVTIPSSVTTIGYEAFYGCSGLTSLTIPSSVTTIGSWAFSGCSRLTSVTIMKSKPISIGSSTFSNQSNATLYVPYGCKAAYEGAYGWKDFKEIIEMKEGDINVDGEWDNSDIDLLAKMLIGKTEASELADVNKDGKISLADLTALTNLIMEKTWKLSLSATSLVMEIDDVMRLKASSQFAGYTLPSLTWSSSDESVAEVTRTGIVSAVGYGTCTITCSANDDSGNIATCEVMVPLYVSGITLSKNSLTLPVNGSQVLTPTIAPAGATTRDVTWRSSDESVATVDDTGRVTAVGVGSCTITCAATDGSGVTATCEVTVWDLVLSASTLNVELNETQKLTVSTNPSSVPVPSVTWTSSNESVATVTETGQVTAVGYGNCVISCKANDGSGLVATCQVTVPVRITDITLSTSSLTLPKAGSQALTATIAPVEAKQIGVTWSSNNENVATVDASGRVTAVGAGTCTITCAAADDSGVAASCTVTVWELVLSATTLNLEVDGLQKLSVSTNPSSFSVPNVTWTSSDYNIADVTNRGIVCGIGVGTCTITCTATDGSGLSATCTVIVSN